MPRYHFMGRLACYLLGFFFLGVACWTGKYFGQASIDKALSTLTFGNLGIVQADPTLIRRFLEWTVVWPLILAGLCVMTEVICHRFFRKRFRRLPLWLLLVGILSLGYQYQATDYLYNFFVPAHDYFSPHFRHPASVRYQAKHPKNLVLIYVEGLETTYSNQRLFGEDLLAGLKNIKQPHFSFKRFSQVSGADWTIAGIVASQCGVPLKILTIFDGNRVGEQLTRYLPGAYCLSDILSDHGYQNIFLKGASLRFSGFDGFIKTHHYDKALGKEEWLANGMTENDMMGWGLPDDLLFEQAKIQLADLMRKGKPFNLSLLTVNTHGFDGQIDKTCRAKGARHFTGIIKCTANDIVDFIQFVDSKGWLDQVVVVVMGDHLAMRNAVYHKLLKSKERAVFNLVVGNIPLKKNSDHITHFDWLPTLLQALGFRYGSDHLALGYSAIGDFTDKKKVRAEMASHLASFKSKAYNQLWLKPIENSAQIIKKKTT